MSQSLKSFNLSLHFPFMFSVFKFLEKNLKNYDHISNLAKGCLLISQDHIPGCYSILSMLTSGTNVSVAKSETMKFPQSEKQSWSRRQENSSLCPSSCPSPAESLGHPPRPASVSHISSTQFKPTGTTGCFCVTWAEPGKESALNLSIPRMLCNEPLKVKDPNLNHVQQFLLFPGT